MSDIASISLFDKVINLYFFDEFGNQFDTEVVMPPTGIKPMVSVQGSFIASDVVGTVNLRITNFNAENPLSDYKRIDVVAGYAGTTLTPGSLVSAFSGSVFLAYQESPSPDGITYFQLLSGGNFPDFLNAQINVFYIPGTTINQALRNIAQAMGYTLQSSLNELLLLPSGFSWQGLAKDAIYKLQTAYQFIWYLDGLNLRVYPVNGANEKVFNIQYFSNPPQVTAAGITFTAPWIPDMRPGDLIHVDPKYARLTYGAGIAPLPPRLRVITIEFEFDTMGQANHMSVFAVNYTEVQA